MASSNSQKTDEVVNLCVHILGEENCYVLNPDTVFFEKHYSQACAQNLNIKLAVKVCLDGQTNICSKEYLEELMSITYTERLMFSTKSLLRSYDQWGYFIFIAPFPPNAFASLSNSRTDKLT